MKKTGKHIKNHFHSHCPLEINLEFAFDSLTKSAFCNVLKLGRLKGIVTGATGQL